MRKNKYLPFLPHKFDKEQIKHIVKGFFTAILSDKKIWKNKYLPFLPRKFDKELKKHIVTGFSHCHFARQDSLQRTDHAIILSDKNV